MNTDIERNRQKAREIAETRYWFRWHVIIYIIVNIGLFGIWYLTGTIDFLWPLIPAVFWALGLIAHYMIAYRRVGGGWIEKETEKILQDSSQS
ncbi:MAG: 2TM domain-containing protein [Candidatus Thorarchaeota archaeon]